jgi:hypothetical protein
MDKQDDNRNVTYRSAAEQIFRGYAEVLLSRHALCTYIYFTTVIVLPTTTSLPVTSV